MIQIITKLIEGIFLFIAIWGTMEWITKLLQKEYNEHGTVIAVAVYWSLYITLSSI